jgi:hypothetical protein
MITSLPSCLVTLVTSSITIIGLVVGYKAVEDVGHKREIYALVEEGYLIAGVGDDGIDIGGLFLSFAPPYSRFIGGLSIAYGRPYLSQKLLKAHGVEHPSPAHSCLGLLSIPTLITFMWNCLVGVRVYGSLYAHLLGGPWLAPPSRICHRPRY